MALALSGFGVWSTWTSPARASTAHRHVGPVPVSTTSSTPATTTTSVPMSGGLAWPPVEVPASVQVAAAAVASLPVYRSPDPGSYWQTLSNPNQLGAPLDLLVVQTRPDWVETYLPERPNFVTGWVPAGDVSLSTDPYRIEISLSARQLILYRSGTPVLTASAAIGEPSSPTPTGNFFVTEVLQVTDSGSAYGPYALGLSAFSDTYASFDGGPGQVAIHGTNEPWLVGGYASHGCVRLDNADITTLATQVSAGTPVDIQA